MATYREFREQTKRRRRKRAVRRLIVLIVVILTILGLAFLITRLIEPDSDSQQNSDPVTSGDEIGNVGISSEVLAPLPGSMDPADTVWNHMGPVEQTLDYTIRTPDYRLLSVPENGIVDYSYFDRAVIVGDSVSQGWDGHVYATSPLKDHAFVCAYKNIGPKQLVNKQAMDARSLGRTPDEDGYGTIIGSNPLRVYILLGANSLVRDGEEMEKSFLAYYSQLLDMFKADLAPEVKIYVQSITPVRPGIKQPGLYKERIMRVNNQLAALAAEKGCYFLNIYDILADENGNLREEYDSDGVHITPAAYEAVAYYMATHTVWDARNPYLPGSPYYVAP